MQNVIKTKNDLLKLQGKWVLQVNTKDPDMTLGDTGWDFVKEKRLNLIAGTSFVSLYGRILEFGTFEGFQKYFNEYDTGGNQNKETRFHRLLYGWELDILNEKMKAENY